MPAVTDAGDAMGLIERARTRPGVRRRAVLAVVALAAAVTAAVALPLLIPTAAADEGQRAETWQRYAPLIFLHPDDPIRPMTAAAFVAGSRFRWSHDGGCGDHELAPKGATDPAKLGSGGYQHQEADAICRHNGKQWNSREFTRPRQDGGPSGGEGFFLDLDNALRNGEGTGAPVYYDYSPGSYVTYWFFYGFNDAPTQFADHEGDWERISIRLDAADQPTTIAYFQHGGYCVMPFGSAPHTGERPIGYSADGSHATYPTVGDGNDRGGSDRDTAEGPPWSTWGNLLDVRAQGWFGYGGAWGEVGELEYTTGVLGPSEYKTPTPGDWSGPAC